MGSGIYFFLVQSPGHRPPPLKKNTIVVLDDVNDCVMSCRQPIMEKTSFLIL